MLDLLRIGNDDFIRTTQQRHTRRVQAFMQTLYDRGDLYESTYAGPYCVSCEAYYTLDELVDAGAGNGDDAGGVAGAGDGRVGLCPIHLRPVETLEQENWFFRLSRYGPDLLRLYDERPDFVRPEVRRNEVRSFVEAGLEDVSVTRQRLGWGVPVPWAPDQVFYVWFDALLNYATAVGFPALDDADADAGTDAFARRWPPDVHLVGKDIVRFHAVYWPAMLMAAGVEVPRQVFAHGFLLVGGTKMSKTNATGIAPADLVEHFGVDCYRYFFLREISFGQDGSFSWEAMETRYTTDLANDLGNLANRVLSMVGRYRGGVVPGPAGQPGGAAGGADPGGAGSGEAEAALAADLRTAVDGPARLRPAGLQARPGGPVGPGARCEPVRRGHRAVGAQQGRRRHRPGPVAVHLRRRPAGHRDPGRAP